MNIRKANVNDVANMQVLINKYADKGELLPRSLNQLYENIRDFIVVEIDGTIIGTCALHICWSDLAEVKGLVVDKPYQKKGYGRALVETCINEARELGIYRVFALTYRPEFFKKLGFYDIDKSQLPQKVWTECINCVKFPNCGEFAVMLDIEK